MGSEKQPAGLLDEVKIPVRLKLSWCSCASSCAPM